MFHYLRSLYKTTFRYEPSGIVAEKILLPAGDSEFHVELEWRNRQVSYRLIMRNHRTDKLRTVDGKWIENTPTGTYKIVFDY